MRLLELHARDWMGYALLAVDFRDVTAFAISGENNAGKSAIQNAVTQALYGRVGRAIDQRSADKLARRGSAGFMVRVLFETGTNPPKLVEVTREKPLGGTGTLSLVVDGVSQRGHIIGRKGDEEGTLDETQGRIEALIGLPYDALVSGPFMVQAGSEAESGSFVKAKPAARKDLLIKLLGLDAYERLHDYAKEQAAAYFMAASNYARDKRELGETVAVADAEAPRLADGREYVKTTKADVERLDQTATDLRVELATANVANEGRNEATRRSTRAVEAWKNADLRVDEARDALEKVAAAAEEEAPTFEPLPEVPTDDDRATAQSAYDKAQRDWREAEGIRGQVEALRAEVGRAERARAIVATVPCGGEGIYATCQFLRDVPPQDDIDSALTRLHNAEAHLDGANHERAVNDAQRMLTLYDRAMAAHARRVEDQNLATEKWRMRVDAATRVRDAYAERVTAAFKVRAEAEKERADAAAALEALGPPVDLTQLQARSREAVETAYRARSRLEQGERELAALEARAAVADAARAKLAEVTIAEGKASRIAEMWRNLENTWHRDGAPTSLIEMAVPLIESKANEVLSRFPEDLTIALRTKRPTKRGSGMAELLDVVVTIGGEESDPGLLSVGANFRIDIALRLALAEILTVRSGARVNTLWLDEPLASLDASGREAVVEVIAALQDDFGLIAVVSHHDDFTERYPTLRVDKQNGVSTATWL